MVGYLIVFFCLFFIWLSWNYPKWSLFLILCFLPTYQIRTQIFNIPITLLEVMIVILFLVWLARIILQITDLDELRLKELKSWFFPILAWLAVATIAIFVSPDLRAAAGIWKAYFIEPILLLIVFISLIKDKKDLKLIFLAFIFSAVIVSIYALYQKFIGQGVWSTEVWGKPKVLRVISFFPHPNFLGLYLGPLIILGLSYILLCFKNKKVSIVFAILFFIITFLSLIFARSEGAILAVLAGLFLLGLIVKQTQKYVFVALIITLLVVFAFPVSRNYLIQKIGLHDLSGQLRVNIWKGAFDMIRHKPILGVGLDGYQRLVSHYQKRFYDKKTGELISVETHPYPHDLFLAVWLELGLSGLAILFWILIKFFKQGFENIKKEPIILYSVMSAMIVMLIHGLVDTPYFKNDLSILFWLLIGLVIFFKKSKIKETGGVG